MATHQEERIKGLETQVGNIRERLAKIEGRLDAPAPKSNHSGVKTAAVAAVCAGIVAYLGWLGVEVVDQGKKIAVIYAAVSPQILKKSVCKSTRLHEHKTSNRSFRNRVTHQRENRPSSCG